MAKQRAVKKGFDTIPTYFTDTSVSSPDVFKITKLPLRFTAGKNLIKLQGNTDNLKLGTLVDVEVLDYNGDPIYSEFIDYLEEDKSRVIAIYVYEDTSPGDCTVTITGTLSKLNGQPVPQEWQGKTNVKWIKQFPVNPTDPNETEIIFTKEPTITVEENVGVQLDRNYTTTQFPTYTTGTVEYFFKNNQSVLQLVGGKFEGDMIGGTITVSSPTNPTPTPNYTPSTTQFTSKIKKVLNENSVTLETPFTVLSNKTISSHTYNHFDPSSFSLSYEADPTYVATQNSESFALLQINDLDPATGDISRIKVYTNGSGTVGTWEQVNDVLLEGTEIFVDSTASLTPDQSIGIFTTQSIIDTYWEGHLYLGNSESTEPALLWRTGSINNGMLIRSTTNINAKTDVLVAQVTDQYSGFFVSQSQYKVTIDAFAERSILSDYNNPKLSIYASGSAFNFDTTDVLNQSLPVTLGKKIGEIESTAKTSQRYDDIEFEFKSDQSGNGSLLFVVEAGKWYIADIRTLTSAEIGYSPNYTRIRSEIPTKHKSDNQLSFKVEYYNVIGDRSKTISYVNNKTWEGGNRYIDGAFSMLTGSLYVADTLESGIDISGLKDTGFIRSLPYGGFNQATGSGAPGFLLFSGSALPNQSETTYEGVGLEMVADANNYFRFRTNPSILDIRTETIFLSGSNVEINTPNFFLGVEGGVYLSGSNGNIAISASNFSVSQEGSVTASNALFSGVALANIIRDKTIIVNDGNSGSYLQLVDIEPGGGICYATQVVFDGSLGGETVRRLRIATTNLPYSPTFPAGTNGAPIGDFLLPELSSTSKLDFVLEFAGDNKSVFDVFTPSKAAGGPSPPPFSCPPDYITLEANSVLTFVAGGAGSTWLTTAGTQHPFDHIFNRNITIGDGDSSGGSIQVIRSGSNTGGSARIGPYIELINPTYGNTNKFTISQGGTTGTTPLVLANNEPYWGIVSNQVGTAFNEPYIAFSGSLNGDTRKTMITSALYHNWREISSAGTYSPNGDDYFIYVTHTTGTVTIEPSAIAAEQGRVLKIMYANTGGTLVIDPPSFGVILIGGGGVATRTTTVIGSTTTLTANGAGAWIQLAETGTWT